MITCIPPQNGDGTVNVMVSGYMVKIEFDKGNGNKNRTIWIT